MPMIAFWLGGLTLFGAGWVYPWIDAWRAAHAAAADGGARDATLD